MGYTENPENDPKYVSNVHPSSALCIGTIPKRVVYMSMMCQKEALSSTWEPPN